MVNKKKTLIWLCRLFLAAIVVLLIVNPMLALGAAVTGMKIGEVLPTLDPSELTFSTEEENDMSKFIYDKIMKLPGLSDIHFIEQGIWHDKDIVFMKRMGLVGKRAVPGECAPPVNPNKIKPSKKKWEPKYATDRFQDCWANLYDNFVKLQLRANSQKPDISATAWIKYLEDTLSQDAIPQMILRILHFSDENADEVAPYGAGELTGGTDPEYFQVIKAGLWKQVFDIAAANPARKVDIAANSGVDYDAQQFGDSDITAGTVMKIFRLLIQKAHPDLRGDSSGIIMCTQSMADEYLNELEHQGVDASFQIVMNGMSVLKRQGVTIFAINFWDEYIKKYYDNGTTLLLPHRALYTVKENQPVGFEEANSLAQLTTYYDPKDKDYTIDFGVTLDAKVLKPEMLQVGY